MVEVSKLIESTGNPVKIVTLRELEITWAMLTTNVGSGMPSDGSMLGGFS